MSKFKQLSKKVKGFYNEYEWVILGTGVGIVSGLAILAFKENGELKAAIRTTKDAIALTNNEVCDLGKAQDIIVDKLINEEKGSEACIEAMCKQAYLHGVNQALYATHKTL